MEMIVVATEKVMVVVVKVKSGRFSMCVGERVKLCSFAVSIR